MGMKRACYKKIFLTPREKEAFQKIAEGQGLSLSAFIRSLLYEKSKEKETVRKF